jgi:transcriptional regulator with XRE-family HTH domain
MPKLTLKMPPEVRGLPSRLKTAMGDMTQDELKKRSGVAQSAISRLLNRKRASGGMIGHIVLIAKALNVRVGYLAVGEEPMRRPGETEPPPLDVIDADAQDAPNVRMRAKNKR